MARSLPPHPIIEALKKQAKELLQAYRHCNKSTCKTLRLIGKFAKSSDEQILSADVGLQEVQHALALDYGFNSWLELKQHVELLNKVHQRLSYWERFGPPEGWAGNNRTY